MTSNASKRRVDVHVIDTTDTKNAKNLPLRVAIFVSLGSSGSRCGHIQPDVGAQRSKREFGFEKLMEPPGAHVKIGRSGNRDE